MANAERDILPAFPDAGHPPEALISDLDGTLTETELLKVSLFSLEPLAVSLSKVAN